MTNNEYFNFSATVDIGYDREKQEDYVSFSNIGDNLLVVIADGTGSSNKHLQPGAIVCTEIESEAENLYEQVPKEFENNISKFLKLSMINASHVLEGFKKGNEEKFGGYAASVTVLLVTKENKIYVAHAGNTRLYILRNGQIGQLTVDHTKGTEYIREGKLTRDLYYTHPSSRTMTSGLGLIANPEIQTFSGNIMDQDILLMTTDGIHYAIQDKFIAQIIIESGTPENATANLVTAAKELKYPDNMTAVIIQKKSNL